MTSGNRLLRHTAAYTVGGALQLIVTLALLPVTTRVLQPDDYGMIVTLLLVGQLAVHIGSAGLPVATMREHFDGDFGPQRSLQLVVCSIPTSVIAVVLLLSTSFLWSDLLDSASATWALWLILIATIPRSFTASLLGNVRARHEVRQFLGLSLATTAGAQIAALALAWVGNGSTAYFGAGYLVGSVAAALFGWVKVEYPHHLPTWPDVRRVSRYALPVVPHLIATLVLQAGDRVVIGSALGLAEVGRYQVAYLLASLPVPLLVAFNNAWSPRLASARTNGEFVAGLQKVANPLVVLIPCIGAACAVIAPVAIAVGLPASYDAADLRGVIAVVSSVGLTFALYVIATQVLVIGRETRALAVVTPIVAALNLGLNVLLVPPQGLLGAAVATAVSYLVMAVLLTILARRLTPYTLSMTAMGSGVVITAYGFITLAIGVTGWWSACLRTLAVVPLLVVAVAAVRTMESFKQANSSR